MSGFAIAVDGPASSGKGTVARLVAHDLGFAYIDTGAMYRAVALFGDRAGLDLRDGPGLAAMIPGMRFAFTFNDGAFQISVNGEDISRTIRSQEVGQGASAVATLPEVRRALLDTQRGLATEQGVVMDGRDIGTVVLPQAQLKVYLDAEVSVRARRRYEELAGRGEEVRLAQVLAELQARDEQDSGRAHAPLSRAQDAVAIDSTDLTPEAIVRQVLRLALARGARRDP